MWDAAKKIIIREGAGDCAFIPFCAIEKYMAPGQAGRARAACPGLSSLIVAVFPYFAGHTPGNISKYARAADYHLVVMRRLSAACRRIKEIYPAVSLIPFVDASPIPEVIAAALSGLAFKGINGLAISPAYGSYIFIATILTDSVINVKTSAVSSCSRCMRCVGACPGKCIDISGAFCAERCISYITQKRGRLSSRETALILNSPYIWGCDICQDVCPHNKDIPLTGIDEFIKSPIFSLYAGDLCSLSDRLFKIRYPERAFTWRGAGVLRRNLSLFGGGCEPSGREPPV